jgi:hypothetical protein
MKKLIDWFTDRSRNETFEKEEELLKMELAGIQEQLNTLESLHSRVVKMSDYTLVERHLELRKRFGEINYVLQSRSNKREKKAIDNIQKFLER